MASGGSSRSVARSIDRTVRPIERFVGSAVVRQRFAAMAEGGPNGGASARPCRLTLGSTVLRRLDG
ncbi:hypothetical protein FMEAI12_3650025 [Parafrankia sp. Ea1.12]|nr:hypothetical protein FMEAI12_3650025 [Parafrankia sp. Ea1.12]